MENSDLDVDLFRFSLNGIQKLVSKTEKQERSHQVLSP